MEKITILIITIQMTLNFCLHAQQVDLNVRGIVDRACLCLQKAQSDEEANKCIKDLDPLRSITSISKDDSLYILSVFSKNGSCKKSRKNQCNFLQDSDMSNYHLKKIKDTKDLIEWENDGTAAQKIMNINDYRKKIETGSESQLEFEKTKQRIIGELDLKVERTSSSPIHTEVYSSEWIMNTTLIHVFMRYENLTGYTTILFNGEIDKKVEMEIVEKLSTRMKEICD